MGEHERRRRLLIATAALTVIAAAVVAVVAASGGSGKRSSTTESRTTTTTSTASVRTTTTSSTTAAALTPAGPPAQPPPPGPQQFGASVNWLFEVAGDFTPRQVNAELDDLRSAGGTLARSDALWEATEPAAPVAGVHRYNWGFDDLTATALASHDLRWFPIIDYTAPWNQSVQGEDHSPPASPADYGAYAGAFAARYGPAGSFWRAHPTLPALPVETIEIWNEPDSSPFWKPAPNAATYDELYLRARNAILAASPTIRVIVGGLTNPRLFLRLMLEARPDMLGHIDGVGIHPYGNDPHAVGDAIKAASETVRALGMGSTPLYVTEFGWTTSPPGVNNYLPERLRPAYIERTLKLIGHSDCAVAATLLYTWITPRLDPANGQQWFGVQAPDGSSSPDGEAFVAGVRAASAPGPAIPLCSGAP
jgi:hypothetical protein